MHSPYCAYLRVYEPLVAFDADERAAWQSYAGRARALECANWDRPGRMCVGRDRGRD